MHGLHQSQALVANHQPDTRKAPGGQVSEELQPALLVLLHTLANTKDFPISFGISVVPRQLDGLRTALSACAVRQWLQELHFEAK
jgi:hypothetical protein